MRHCRSNNLKVSRSRSLFYWRCFLRRTLGGVFRAELLKAMATITGAIDTRLRITRQSFQNVRPADSRARTRKPPTRLALKKISVARLPVTGSDVFGREEAIGFLDRAWANQDVNVVLLFSLIPSGSGGRNEKPGRMTG